MTAALRSAGVASCSYELMTGVAAVLRLPGQMRQRRCKGPPPRRRACRLQAHQAPMLADTLPLSTYKFPQGRKPALRWLEASVQEAVRHIDEAPFLQLYVGNGGRHMQRHRVPEAVVYAPQLWPGIAEFLTKSRPDIMVLIHALDGGTATERRKASQGDWGPDDILTGITSQHHSRLQDFAHLVETGVAHAEFSGRVGECCDDEAVSQVVPFTRQTSARHSFDPSLPRPHAHRTQSARKPRDEQVVAYYGVVVQSSQRSEAEGCFVLKTVHSVPSDSVDCTCTHFTLTRVCRGEPIAAQLSAAWLA